jgi:hypothetical protein
MPTHVTALFADRHSVHAAVEQLVQAGFTRDAISVVMSENTHEREFGGSSAERSGLRSIPAGVLRGIISALVKLPPIGSGLALWGAGPLAGRMRRFLEGETRFALESAFVAGGLPQHEANFVSGGIRDGSLAVCVAATEDRLLHLAAQLLELSGGDALQAA